jgi:hypothetical protein
VKENCGEKLFQKLTPAKVGFFAAYAGQEDYYCRSALLAEL